MMVWGKTRYRRQNVAAVQIAAVDSVEKKTNDNDNGDVSQNARVNVSERNVCRTKTMLVRYSRRLVLKRKTVSKFQNFSRPVVTENHSTKYTRTNF